MPKKVRTAKGRTLDFDLLRIKEQLAAGAKPQTVQARQDFIDQKMRRRVKKIKDQLTEAKKKNKGVDVTADPKVQSDVQGPKIDEAQPLKRKLKRKT